MSANSYRMLVACGYSADEASRISGYTPPKRTMADVAAENELKYGGLLGALIAAGNGDEPNGDISGIYEHIENFKPDTGRCTTRGGVYRRLKFGAGNKSESQWMQEGFKRNVK